MKRTFSVQTLCYLIAIGMILGGTYWVIKVYAKLERYNKTKGKIIKLEVKRRGMYDPDRDVIYYPRIQFYDENGQAHVFQSKVGSERPLAQEGEEIDLFVNPSNQNDVLINSFMYLWFGPTLLIFAGVVLLIIFKTVIASRER